MKKRLSLRKAKIVAMLDYSCGINIAVLKLDEYGFKVSDYFKRLDEIASDDDFDAKNIEARDNLFKQLNIAKVMNKAYAKVWR